MCGVVPMPLVAMVSSPGRARANANRSSSERTGLPAATSMPKVTLDTWMTGVTSRIGSHSTFCVCGARKTGCGICAMV